VIVEDWHCIAGAAENVANEGIESHYLRVAAFVKEYPRHTRANNVLFEIILW
jgi:hypothetical protein